MCSLKFSIKTFPDCNGYWRSGPFPNICPYCAIRAHGYQFLSESQLHYVRYYCEILNTAMHLNKENNVIIDMDIVADATGKESSKPSFYISEKTQQKKSHVTLVVNLMTFWVNLDIAHYVGLVMI